MLPPCQRSWLCTRCRAATPARRHLAPHPLPFPLAPKPCRYSEAEKTNGRWAMMAVAGILGTEALGLPKWWEAGAASDIPTAPLAATTFLFTGAAETFRYKGWKETGTVSTAEPRDFLGLVPGSRVVEHPARSARGRPAAINLAGAQNTPVRSRLRPRILLAACPGSGRWTARSAAGSQSNRAAREAPRATFLTHATCRYRSQSGFLFSFPFDPAGMNSKDMAVKEVKNGRLAMVSCVATLRVGSPVRRCWLKRFEQSCLVCARRQRRPACANLASQRKVGGTHGLPAADAGAPFVQCLLPVQVAFIGFAVQALVSRTTPLEGLGAHLGNPAGRNITYYLTHLPETLGAQ